MSLRSVVLSSLLLFSAPALAGVGDPGCPCEADRAKLQAFRDDIASADTPEHARDMALDKIRIGHKAIHKASRMMPGESGFAEADAKLSAFEGSVAAASTQEEVADQFDQLMARPTGMSCSYDTVEVVVIVIGFLLGIIPGIIFLFLFC
jgi:hypothetical protein